MASGPPGPENGDVEEPGSVKPAQVEVSKESPHAESSSEEGRTGQEEVASTSQKARIGPGVTRGRFVSAGVLAAALRGVAVTDA